MTKGRSKRMPETIRVSPEADVHELPPRRVRHKRVRFSYKAVLSSGLAIFGTLFLVLVAAELYQAHQTLSETLPPGNETAQAERAAVGQASAFAQADGSAPSALPIGATAVGGGEGQQATATINSASSGALLDGSARTESNAVAVTAAEKPAAETTNTTIPASSQQTSSSGKVQAAKPAPKVKRHVVQKGDTLYKLSRLYYGNNGGVSRIAGYNGISPEAKLKAGDVLSIPLSP